MKRLAGKVAVVLPGTFGLGHEAARGFAAEGAKVLVAGFFEKNGRATVDAIAAEGGEARFAKTDLLVEADVAGAVAAARAARGRVDAALALADYHTAGLCHEEPLHSFDATLRFNARSCLLLAKHAIPAMLETGGGSVVFLSSIYAVVSGSVSAAYEVSKSMTIALGRALGERYAARGVRVNSIVAGHVRAKERPGIEAEFRGTDVPGAPEAERLGGFYPTKRIADPEEIVRAAIYLASEESSFVNATALHVDGGFVAR